MTGLRLGFCNRASAYAALLGAATALLSVGCSVGPAYHRPQAPLPEQWRTQAAPEQKQWPDADWWHLFGSPTLEHYLALAQTNGDDIAAAIARVHEADAQAMIAGAPLYPALTVGAVGIRTKGFSASATSRPFTEYSAPAFTASYVLDFWGKNRAAHSAAILNAQASRYDRQIVTLTITTNVAQFYFQALELHDLLQVTQNNLERAQTILNGLQLEQQVGTATALDVAQQAAVVASINASIPPLVQQLNQTTYALAVLLGQPPEALEPANAGLVTITLPPVIEGLPSELLERRPDIAESEAQLHAANANMTVARAAYFPNVQLTATGGFASTILNTLLQPQARVFQLTATVAQNIFQGGAVRGQVLLTQARYTELLANYHKTVLSALSDVEGTLTASQQLAEQERRQQVATDEAQRAFDYAQQQMAVGTTNILTVLNTETTLFTDESQLVVVKFQHLQALLQLYRALGGGWQQSQETL
jgi:NodT family efflux transporter outer membrane factor (OMF) lipoprotein